MKKLFTKALCFGLNYAHKGDLIFKRKPEPTTGAPVKRSCFFPHLPPLGPRFDQEWGPGKRRVRVA